MCLLWRNWLKGMKPQECLGPDTPPSVIFHETIICDGVSIFTMAMLLMKTQTTTLSSSHPSKDIPAELSGQSPLSVLTFCLQTGHLCCHHWFCHHHKCFYTTRFVISNNSISELIWQVNMLERTWLAKNRCKCMPMQWTVTEWKSVVAVQLECKWIGK